MITLFRRIRQKLIASGSVTKYVLYAIGEIMLVVIGILVALQVNNWNDERLARIAGAEFEERLLEDMQEEKAIMESVFEYLSLVKQNADTAATYYEAGGLSNRYTESDFIINLYQASQIYDPFQSRSTYNELLSSGQFGKIGNVDLRSAIISYYETNWSEAKVFAIESPYRENIRRVIPSSIQSRIREQCGDRYYKVRKSLLVSLPERCGLIFDEERELAESTVQSILNDPSLRSDLRFYLSNLDAQLSLVSSYKKEVDSIIQQLEQAL